MLGTFSNTENTSTSFVCCILVSQYLSYALVAGRFIFAIARSLFVIIMVEKSFRW